MEYGPIDIFRTGSWTSMNGQKVTIGEGELAAIADSYDPYEAPAPAVIGHPENDAPAYAWVEQLYVEGGKLKATLREAATEFVDWVKTGRYRKISVSLYQPDAPNNPTPGRWHLKHVGFLGGAAPAVSGLAPVGFACREDAALVFEEESYFAERAAVRREREEMRIDKLISEGRTLPVFREELLSFIGSLDDDATFSFAEGKKQTPREWFLSYLQRMPKVVEFGALARDDNSASAGDAGNRKVKHPAGYGVDQDGALLFTQASELAERDKISFADAARRIELGR